ncbi:MAG: response regulator, partial [Gammaproteobacteria bacterium]
MSEMKQSPSGGHEAVAVPPGPDAKKMRLLLIEDQNTARVVLLQKLRAAGFDVDIAPNGRVALEKLRSGQPDAIFMDLLLPQVKGVDVIKEARRNKGFGDRPIYVCTSAANMEAWTKRGTKAGATKTFDRAATSIDAVVAAVAADLIGPAASKEPTESQPESQPKDKAEPEVAPEPPSNPRSTVAGTDTPAQSTGKDSVVAEPVPERVSLFQQVLQALGLARKPRKSSRLAPPARSKPIPATAGPNAMKSAPGAPRNPGPIGTAAPAPHQSRTSGEPVPAPTDGVIAPAAAHGGAVLTLDQAGKILSADDGCVAMFGWDAAMLVGVDLKVLLKEGLEQGVEAFLQRHRGGDASKASGSLPLIARRRDGTEFPASVTTLTWSSETTLIRKSEGARACWTAVFRDLTCAATAPVPAATVPQAGSPGAAVPSMPATENISRLKQSHAALEKTNAELQRQLQELSSETARQREAIANSQKERQAWEARIRSKELALDKVQSDTGREALSRKQLEQQLQDLAAANAQLTAQQQASAESRKRGEELENRLRETVGDLECLRADAATRSDEKENLESALREELIAARKAAEQAEAALKKETARNQDLEKRLQILGNNLRQEQNERSKRFEHELAALRKERDELSGKLTAEQQAVAESKRRAEELEVRLRDNATEFAGAKAELDKQTVDRQRSEAEWRGQLETAKALTRTLEAACAEAV